MASTDSRLAESMKEQVLTTMTSASSARTVSSAPPWESRPIMTSLSTRFFGQPKLTKPTFGLGRASTAFGAATVRSFTGMESIYSNIPQLSFEASSRTSFARRDFLVEFRQALSVGGGVAEACFFVVLREALHGCSEMRVFNQGDELGGSVRRRLAPAAPGDETGHARVPDAGRHLRSALRTRGHAVVARSAQE